MAKAKVDLSGVRFPEVKARKKEMMATIRMLIKRGYTKFLTRTTICLNCVESPDSDVTPDGYKSFGFWHDCHKREVETGEYNDTLLYAAK